MTRTATTLLILAALVAAGGGGYWIGKKGPSLAPEMLAEGALRPTKAPSGPVIYYQDPDGKPLYAAEPKSTADGRAFRAVLASEDVSFDPPEAPAVSEPSQRRVLYYRNPMGLPDISKTPKKDPMGMDYIAVYEGEEDGSSVKISPGKLQRIGVATEPAKLRVIEEPVRAPGTIQLDERRIAVISIRAEGFVDTVENVTTGSEVRKDQPLFRLYSPAIASAAAVGSSSSDAPAVGSPVRSAMVVWKLSSASSRPWEISGWYGVYAVYQPGSSSTPRRITGGVIVSW